MPSLCWKQLIGQQRIKGVLEAAFRSNTLGHAYLFCGDSGTGKFAAALELAMALHCNDDTECPCYRCESCRKMLHYAHPDFHIIMPVALKGEYKSSDGKLNETGWDYLAQCARERIENPYLQSELSSIPTIPVEWVREVNHAITRGNIAGGKNVVIMGGIDEMKKESANAMLKTLEEPPPDTLMLLLTERIHTVLPTIISRCQIVRFAYCTPEEIRKELVSRFSLAPDDKRMDTLVRTGSIGRAISLLEYPADEIREQAIGFWNTCIAGNWDSITQQIDTIAEMNDISLYEKLFIQIIEELRDAYYYRELGEDKNNFSITKNQEIELGGFVTPEGVESVVYVCQEAISAVKARGNITLLLVNFVLSIMEIYNGEK